MIYRSFAVVSALGVSVLLSLTPVAGQTTKSVGEPGGSLPRTPWGRPDLRGMWTNTTTTPMERPADLEGGSS